MSKYFTPISLQTEKPKEPEKKVEITPQALRKEVDRFHTETMRIFTAVQNGSSSLCKATRLANAPALTAIEKVNTTPTKKNFLELFHLTAQDMNRRVSQEVEAVAYSLPTIKALLNE